MPKAPYRLCKCGERVRGKCRKCARANRKASDKRRGTAAERGYDYWWQRAAKRYRKLNPLCVACLREGQIVAAEVVDHIIPHRGDERLRKDEANWQSLCKRCHDQKTAREDGGFGR